MSDGVVTFVTDQYLWVIPRCEVRLAHVKAVEGAINFVIELEHGQRMKTAVAMSRHRADNYAEWKYTDLEKSRIFVGHEVAQLMIRDLRADIPVDVLWQRDVNLVWTRTEGAR